MKWKFLVLIFKGLFVKKQSYKVSPTQFWRWNSCGHLAIGAERGWYDLDPAEQANEAVGAHSSRNLPQGVMFINYKPIKNDWVIKKIPLSYLVKIRLGSGHLFCWFLNCFSNLQNMTKKLFIIWLENIIFFRKVVEIKFVEKCYFLYLLFLDAWCCSWQSCTMYLSMKPWKKFQN